MTILAWILIVILALALIISNVYLDEKINAIGRETHVLHLRNGVLSQRLNQIENEQEIIEEALTDLLAKEDEKRHETKPPDDGNGNNVRVDTVSTVPGI